MNKSFPLPVRSTRRMLLTVLLGIACVAGNTGVLAQEQTAAPAATATPDAVGESYGLVVFGATPAGVCAAVAAARRGERVALVEPSYLLGGMMSGGLTKTDMGRTEAIGGMAREFYDRVLDYYTKTYGANSSQVKECNKGYYFESKLAGQLFRQMLDEAHVSVFTKERLESVEMNRLKIGVLNTRNYASGEGSRWKAAQFVDATYEGDLMAAARVMYRVGREARCEFNESMAGVNEGPEEYLGTGDHRVQTYNIRGGLTDRPDAVLPFPKPTRYYPEAAEALIRTVVSRKMHTWRELYPGTDNWGKINGHYDSNSGDHAGINYAWAESDYEARERIAQHVRDYWLSAWWALQNDPSLPADFRADAMKFGVPRDEYLESGHVTPQIYVRESRRMLGRYFLTQKDLVDDRFKPDTVCLGNYGFDSHKVQFMQTAEGLIAEGDVSGSTDLYAIPYRSLTPYGVPNLLVVCAVSASSVAYSSLRMEPIFMMLGQAAGEATHLAIGAKTSVQDVPVAALQAELKKSGVPLEPTFRPVVEIRVKTPAPYRVGQPVEFELVSKQTRTPLKTIAWNFDGSGAVQAGEAQATYTFPGARQARVLLSVTDTAGNKSQTQSVDLLVGENPVPDVEVSRTKAKLKGHWSGDRGVQMEYYYRMGVVDIPPRGDEPGKSAADTLKYGDGQNQAVFTAKLPRPGRYQVAMAFPSTPTAATNVPVTITHAGGDTKVSVNEKKAPPFAYSPLGEFRFDQGTAATVTITNEGTDGRVAIDSVRWIYLGE